MLTPLLALPLFLMAILASSLTVARLEAETGRAKSIRGPTEEVRALGWKIRERSREKRDATPTEEKSIGVHVQHTHEFAKWPFLREGPTK